jgi:protein tyrosine/serine phosphatase
LLAAANVVLLAIVAVLVGGQMRQASRLPRGFHVVEPQRLYRSGQPTAAQLAAVIKEYGIRTVLNLRNPAEPDYVDDAPAARPYGVRVVSLPITSTWAISDEHLSELRKVYGDPRGYPILVHCEAGRARTGVAVALWRIERQGWDPAAAVDDMIASGYPVREKSAQMRELLLHRQAPAEAAKPGSRAAAPSSASS